MTTTTVEPAIWIADLAAYNSGILHGKWVRIGEDTTIEDLQAAVNEILEEGQRRYSKETLSLHEEFAIHDFEGFGPLKLSEYSSLQSVLEYARHIHDGGDKFFAFIDAMGEDYADEFDSYEVYGPYEDYAEYAWNDLEEAIFMSSRETIHDWLRKHSMPPLIAAAFKFDTDEYIRQVQNEGVAFGKSGGKLYSIEPK